MRRLSQWLDPIWTMFGHYKSPKAPREITGIQVRCIGTIDSNINAPTRYAIVDRPEATITIGDRVVITSEVEGLSRTISMRITRIRKLHTNHVVFRAWNGLYGRDGASWDLYVPYEVGFVSKTVRVIHTLFYPLLTPSPNIPSPVRPQNLLTDTDIDQQFNARTRTVSEATITSTFDGSKNLD